MRDCHLPAYRQHGLTPVAIASRTPPHELAAAFGIPTVHESVDALLADPLVDVLDLAVPPQAQPDLIRRAVAAGPWPAPRHPGPEAARPERGRCGKELVDRCAAAGV